MDEESVQEELPGVTPIGQRLREAREAKGLSIEDIAAKTRIPKRHIESLESADFARLPAPTYTMGFVKSYAGEVGMDRDEAGAQLREEMDGFRPPMETVEGFEPADPNRAMPGWLIWTALILLIGAIAFFIWYNERSLVGDGEIDPPALTSIGTEDAETQPEAGIVPANNVVLIANEAAWVRVTDGDRVLIARELAAGESFVVPSDANAPRLETARPEVLRITVGNRDAPQVGPAGERVTNVSLIGTDLLGGSQTQAPPAAQAGATSPATNPAPRQRQSAPPPAAAPSQAPAPPPAETTAGETTADQ